MRQNEAMLGVVFGYTGPLWLGIYVLTPVNSVLSRKLPRLRPTLRLLTGLVALLSFDFAFIRATGFFDRPEFGSTPYLLDAGALLLPLLIGMRVRLSPFELFMIGGLAAFAGMLIFLG